MPLLQVLRPTLPILIGASIMLTLSMGLRQSLGIFLQPLTHDIRISRCAGAPFRDGNSWIRPAQDGSEIYGSGIRYQRIVTLDPDNYAEVPAGRLSREPFPGFTGVHTYNRAGAIEVIDGRRRIFRTRGVTGK